MRTIIAVLVILFISRGAISQGVFINEIMASNSSTITDEDGEYSDWIELYNSSNSPISLMGYHLSDDIEDIYKWAFPDTVILPNEYLIVFASSKDRAISGAELHSNFKVKSDGEELILSLQGMKIHTAPPLSLLADESFGLYPDGGSACSILSSPSPGYSNTTPSIQHEILFSHEGGCYSYFFDLEMVSSSGQGDVYYTIDGSTPDINSFKYLVPITLNEEILSPNSIYQIQISPDGYYYPQSQIDVPRILVIRAAIIDNLGNLLSSVVTHSYFINSVGYHITNLPLISICGDPVDFFDFHTGILVPGVHFNSNDPEWTGNYYQSGIDWERTVNIEFFENDTNYLNQLCGIRTHGGNSRRFPQKGLRLYARSDYGMSEFNHQLFTNKNINKFKRLVLKPFSSSWSQSGLEDQISSDLASSLNVDFVSSKPVVVYLNGEYWGIYYLQERIDEHYIENNFSIDEECIDMLENWSGSTIVGSNTEFLELYEFIDNNDLATNSNYNFVKEKIDIDNFIDYQLLEIFIANYDWPANNIKLWKSSCGDNKWRWIFFDGDGSMGDYKFESFLHALNTSMDPWPTNATSTLFLRKLLKNNEFHKSFFNRLEHLLNNQFAFDNIALVYQELIEKINRELIYQTNRFKYPTTLNYGISQMEEVNNFLLNRPCELSNQANSDFSTSIIIPKCIQECNEVLRMSPHPNPTYSVIDLSFYTKNALTGHLTISNICGKQIYSDLVIMPSGFNTLPVKNLNALPAGLYIISIITNNCVYSSKFLVMN